jgi:hypothetical protein
MKLTGYAAALAPVFLVAGAIAAGCGSDVATCASICALPNAVPSSCLNDCSDMQKSLTTAEAGDFQAWLTCVQNAGDYSAVNGICASISATVADEARQSPPGGGGDSGADAASRSCTAATCSAVCGLVANSTACLTACTAARAECSASSVAFQALLNCLCQNGGWLDNAPTAAACATDLLNVDQNCVAFNGVADGGR